MLKRLAAVMLLMLYITTVSGFALNLHYCFNRLSSIQIDAPAKGCVKGIATSKMKCCSDKHIEIKVKDCHQGKAPSASDRVFQSLLHQLLIPVTLFTVQTTSVVAIAYRGPPRATHNTPIFLQNCTFRI